MSGDVLDQHLIDRYRVPRVPRVPRYLPLIRWWSLARRPLPCCLDQPVARARTCPEAAARSDAAMAAGELVIEWRSPDGEEHEERWETIDAFLSWAAGEGVAGRYAAYEEDEDGDRVLIERGSM